jgi:predicted DNA-binding transcriptional regulator AlpA
MPRNENLRTESAHSDAAGAAKRPRNLMELLTTKEVATLTGFSTSYFEKGRVYGYGPNFLRIRGRILYRLSEVNTWISAHECEPQGGANAL